MVVGQHRGNARRLSALESEDWFPIPNPSRRGKGGQRCLVCSHREAVAINVAIARGVSVTALSRRYKISSDSIYRHSANHLPPPLRAKLIAGPELEGVDLESLRSNESQSLLANLVALRNRLFGSLDVAEEAADSTMVARIAAQLHRNFELVGKLLGDLASGSTSVTNVLITPQYVELRVELVRALAPYPEARQAVASALRLIETKAANQITAEAERGLAA